VGAIDNSAVVASQKKSREKIKETEVQGNDEKKDDEKRAVAAPIQGNDSSDSSHCGKLVASKWKRKKFYLQFQLMPYPLEIINSTAWIITKAL
jgi:hypothetical protein